MKRKDKRKILEYHAVLKRWQVKPQAGKHTDLCWAYLESEPGVRLDQAPLSMWTFKGDGSWWTEQKSGMVIELENGDIRLEGFSGQHGKKICETYKKKTKENSSFPFYHSSSKDGEKIIEYHVETKTWQLKPADCAGRDSCWAYVLNRKGTLPQHSTNLWAAKDSFEIQEGAKVSVDAYTAKFRVY